MVALAPHVPSGKLVSEKSLGSVRVLQVPELHPNGKFVYPDSVEMMSAVVAEVKTKAPVDH